MMGYSSGKTRLLANDEELEHEQEIQGIMNLSKTQAVILGSRCDFCCAENCEIVPRDTTPIHR